MVCIVKCVSENISSYIIITLVFKVRQTEVIVCRRVVLFEFTCFLQIFNRFIVVFNLSVAVASVEMSFEKRILLVFQFTNEDNRLSVVVYCFLNKNNT